MGGWGFFAGPGGLSDGSVSVEAGVGGGDPVTQAMAGVGEVAVPVQGRGAGLFAVVGPQPLQVQRGQLPDQFGWRRQQGGITEAGSP